MWGRTRAAALGRQWFVSYERVRTFVLVTTLIVCELFIAYDSEILKNHNMENQIVLDGT